MVPRLSNFHDINRNASSVLVCEILKSQQLVNEHSSPGLEFEFFQVTNPFRRENIPQLEWQIATSCCLNTPHNSAGREDMGTQGGACILKRETPATCSGKCDEPQTNKVPLTTRDSSET